MDKLLLKNRILLILVIVLALLNVATIATIIWQTKKINRIDRPFFTGKSFGHKNFQDYIIKELKLNPEQAKAYLTADSIFRKNSDQIFANMKQIRKEMVDEIVKSNPDSLRLNALSLQLAKQHIDLKHNTFEFLFKLKQICNPQQQDILSQHIRRMFEFEDIKPMGKGLEKWKHRHTSKDERPDAAFPAEDKPLHQKEEVPPSPAH